MTEFARPTGIDWQAGGTYGMVQFGTDNNLLVMFYNKSVQDIRKSKEENRPIFNDQVYIQIQHPGENLNKIDRPATDDDKRRFAHHWHKFNLNQSQVPEGTPIALLFPNTPAYPATLAALGIHTVEQAATLSGQAIDSVGMGGQELVNKAKKYLEQSKDSKVYNKLNAENDELRAQIKQLQENQEKQRQTIETMYTKFGHRDAATSPSMTELQNQPFIEGYDVQTERINANHKTAEIKPKK